MIQTTIVVLMIIGALFYLTRRYLGKKKSSCGSCSSCSGKNGCH